MPSRRTRLHAIRAMVLAAVLGAATVAPPSTTAGILPTGCDALAMSPTYDQDGTALCAGYRRMFRTTDRAHSWQQVSASGLPDAGPRQVVFSPRYSSDKTIIVVASGVYVTTNGGDAFTPLDTVDLGPHLTPFTWVGPVGSAVPLEPRAAFAASLGPEDLSAVLDPTLGLRDPVAGAPDRDQVFVVSPNYATDGTAFLLTNGGTGSGSTLYSSLYSCDATFTCAMKLHDFPMGYQSGRAWFAPDFAKSKTFFVSVAPVTNASGQEQVFQTHDGGKTFTAWNSVQTILAGAKVRSAFDIASGPAGSRTLWLRVQSPTDAANPPLERLFRSTDNGTTWRPMGYGRGCCQHGPRGNIPADQALPATGPLSGMLLVSPAGRMLMLGRTNGANIVYCSSDSGRTWHRVC